MRLTWRAVIAALLTLTAVLFAQAAATLWLREQGLHPDLAMNLPRLVGLPVVIGVSWMLLRRCAIDPRSMFARPAPALPLLLSAVLIGVLFRIANWATIHAFGAFGWLESAALAPPRTFGIGWECPSTLVLVVGAISWIVLVPLSEELVHRGVVLSRLAPHGATRAVIGASIVFMFLHQPEGYATAFVAGLILGYQYWVTRSLWVPIVTHATYDGLLIADKLCLKLTWNPPQDEIPVWEAGVPAILVAVASLAAIIALLRTLRTGVRKPRPAVPGTESSG